MTADPTTTVMWYTGGDSSNPRASIQARVDDAQTVNYGAQANESGTAQLVFAPNSPELAGATRMLVQGALTQFLGDWIVVRDVSVSANDAELSVQVAYTLVGSDQVQVAEFVRGGGP